VLAFDWNASGLTTVLTAALKEAIKGQEKDLGFFICGGKGQTSLKTPKQIIECGNTLNLTNQQIADLKYNSRISAKVDSALVQDGYALYHHSFFFTKSGAWTVVQQGMNQMDKSARRYHWHSGSLKDLIVEPHSGIATQQRRQRVLDLTSPASTKSRDISVDLTTLTAKNLLKDLALLDKFHSTQSKMVKMHSGDCQVTVLSLARNEFKHHPVEKEQFASSRYLGKILAQLTETRPKTYEQLLASPGVGPKTIRALALVGEVVYGAKPSYRDPARYSFAHGGKDATPYPVDRSTYDHTITTFQHLIEKSRFNYKDKSLALQRLQPKPKAS
jgi:hypothetical protein